MDIRVMVSICVMRVSPLVTDKVVTRLEDNRDEFYIVAKATDTGRGLLEL